MCSGTCAIVSEEANEKAEDKLAGQNWSPLSYAIVCNLSFASFAHCNEDSWSPKSWTTSEGAEGTLLQLKQDSDPILVWTCTNILKKSFAWLAAGLLPCIA